MDNIETEMPKEHIDTDSLVMRVFQKAQPGDNLTNQILSEFAERDGIRAEMKEATEVATRNLKCTVRVRTNGSARFEICDNQRSYWIADVDTPILDGRGIKAYRVSVEKSRTYMEAPQIIVAVQHEYRKQKETLMLAAAGNAFNTWRANALEINRVMSYWLSSQSA